MRRLFYYKSTPPSTGPSYRSFSGDGVDEKIISDASASTIIGSVSPADMTFMCWLKANAAPTQYDTPFGAEYRSAWSEGCGLFFNSGSVLRGWVTRYNTANSYVDNVDAFTPTNWNHAAVTFHTDAGAGHVTKLYLNGALQGTASAATDETNIFNNAATWNALYNFDGSSWFNGKVAHCAVWNRVLTGPEISSIYTGGGSFNYATVQAANLKMWWRGTSSDSLTAANGVLDASGNGRTATATNMESGDLGSDFPA